MEFKDFKNNPQNLLGKTVIYESGHTYSNKISKSLHKIEKITKTGFRISAYSDALFSLIDGYQKGLNGRMDMSIISRCKLVTDEEANQLKNKWKLDKEERLLREKMQEKLKAMSLDQLKKNGIIVML